MPSPAMTTTRPSRGDRDAASATPSSIPRLWRGLTSGFLGTFCFPLGRFCRARWVRRLEPERLEQGLVLILPGIEGQSFLNIGILQGLLDGGVRSAVEIVDWTIGSPLLAVYNLRAIRRNRRTAQRLAERIVEYQNQYPGRPVHLVGHSGGGGMALLTLESLPQGRRISSAVLLAAAVSPRYDVQAALDHTERGVWSFHSPFDALFLGVGTLLFGTIDGLHAVAAGARGFYPQTDVPSDAAEVRCRQIGYRPAMLWNFHLGGHFGCVNRVFIAEHLAPIVREAEQCSDIRAVERSGNARH